MLQLVDDPLGGIDVPDDLDQADPLAERAEGQAVLFHGEVHDEEGEGHRRERAEEEHDAAYEPALGGHATSGFTGWIRESCHVR